ncbi:hypothetical protein QFZ66_002090 [Streptomyces sp. B4I13]|nr:hypothetical protein [Streptomyces sp. B4I13]
MSGQDLLRHRHRGVVEGGNAGQQVARAAVLGLEHPPAAHGGAGVGRAARVEAAADVPLLLEEVDVRSVESAVADQERGRGERRDTAAHQ